MKHGAKEDEVEHKEHPDNHLQVTTKLMVDFLQFRTCIGGMFFSNKI